MSVSTRMESALRELPLCRDGTNPTLRALQKRGLAWPDYDDPGAGALTPMWKLTTAGEAVKANLS